MAPDGRTVVGVANYGGYGGGRAGDSVAWRHWWSHIETKGGNCPLNFF
jgi:hypothetical protein